MGAQVSVQSAVLTACVVVLAHYCFAKNRNNQAKRKNINSDAGSVNMTHHSNNKYVEMMNGKITLK